MKSAMQLNIINNDFQDNTEALMFDILMNMFDLIVKNYIMIYTQTVILFRSEWMEMMEKQTQY